MLDAGCWLAAEASAKAIYALKNPAVWKDSNAGTVSKSGSVGSKSLVTYRYAFAKQALS